MKKLQQHEIESFLFERKTFGHAVKRTFKTCVAFILRLSALERGALFLTKLVYSDTFNRKWTKRACEQKVFNSTIQAVQWLGDRKSENNSPKPTFPMFSKPTRSSNQLDIFTILCNFPTLTVPPNMLPTSIWATWTEPSQLCLHHYASSLNVVIV